jgi:hypothetical protein
MKPNLQGSTMDVNVDVPVTTGPDPSMGDRETS